MASTCTLLPLLLSTLAALPWAVSIHCNCEHAKCTALSEEACPAGTTQDLCGCCTVCAGAEGEECGGPWGIYGDCGVGLECQQEHCPPGDETLECYHYYLTEPGKCIPRRHRSVILDVLAGPDKTESMKQRHRQRLLRQLELLMK